MPEVTADSLIVARPGRPTRGDSRSERVIRFRLTDQEYVAMQQVAAEQRQKLSSVVREAVNEYVADYTERRVFRTARAFE